MDFWELVWAIIVAFLILGAAGVLIPMAFGLVYILGYGLVLLVRRLISSRHGDSREDLGD